MMPRANDPYAPPRAEAEPSNLLDAEDAFEATKATSIVRTSTGLVAGTALLLEMSALQLVLNFHLVGLARMVTWGLVVLGAVLFVVAIKLYRQRVWAAQAAIGLAATTAIATAGWLLVLLGSGTFSLYALALPPLSIAAAITSYSALAQCKRASAARERLRGEGVVADF
jgi:hypothetical protein